MQSAKNIILIDDDKLFVFLIKKTIGLTGIATNVIDFADGRIVLEHLKQNAGTPLSLPDIIFLDLHMPVFDGWEFLEQYLALEPTLEKKIKLYVFSSAIAPSDIKRAKDLGCISDFITKPILKDKFLEILSD